MDNKELKYRRTKSTLNDKNAKIVLSNSDPKNVDKNDNFFDELYKKYSIDRIMAKRMINANGAKCNSFENIKQHLNPAYYSA